LRTAHTIYVQHHKFPEALALAIRLGDPDLIREDFTAPGNPYVPLPYSQSLLTQSYRLMKRQLAFLLARAQIPLEWLHPPSTEDGDDDADVDIQEEFPEDLLECLSNSRLSAHFREFGKELGVADAKSLEDVYKSHLENTRRFSVGYARCITETLESQGLEPPQTSIQHEEILQELSSTPLSMLVLETTS
jgi:26S proteasome regulatory subunit N1